MGENTLLRIVMEEKISLEVELTVSDIKTLLNVLRDSISSVEDCPHNKEFHKNVVQIRSKLKNSLEK